MFDNAFDPNNDKYNNRGFSDADLTEKPGALKRFCPRVLVGNWAEERYTVVDKHSIIPGLYGISHCQNDPCLYRDSYKRPASNKTEKKVLADDFIELNQIAFENKTHNLRSHLKFYDGDEYFKNLTTSCDLHYRIRPLYLKTLGSEKEFDLPEDSLAGHGNCTGYGLIAAQKCERLAEARQRHDVSVTKEDFTPKCRIRMEDKTDKEIKAFYKKIKKNYYKEHMEALREAQEVADCRVQGREEGIFPKEEKQEETTTNIDECRDLEEQESKMFYGK